MRYIILHGAKLTLDDDGTWHGPRHLADTLNALADISLIGRSPADGDPVAIVFYEAVRILRPDEVYDDTPPRFTPPGVVYGPPSCDCRW